MFNKYVERVLKHEAGYVNHPNDPGGQTNLGITRATLERARRDAVVPSRGTLDAHIRTLPRGDAVSIYEHYYWFQPQYSRLKPAIAFQVFDAGVNHGTGNATRWLQRTAGVADDGVIGPITLSAVNAMSVQDVIHGFWYERIKFYTKLSTFATFGRGWMNRMADNILYSQEDM